jgi:pilus assembly protein FimV
MGEELAPGHPLFATAQPAASAPAESDDPLAPFEPDSYAAVPDEDAPPADVPPPSTPATTDYDFEFESTPHTQAPAATVAPAMEEFDALPPLPADEDVGTPPPVETTHAPSMGAGDAMTDGASDDAVDTKLDLARAYLDMGDPDGARAMLDEVLAEGSQMQKDVARKLLEEMG